MSTNAATEEALGRLHSAIAKRLRVHVDDVESDPRYLQMAIKFVSDNKITCVVQENNDLGALDKSLANRQKRRFGTKGTENITEIATKMAQEAINE